MIAPDGHVDRVSPYGRLQIHAAKTHFSRLVEEAAAGEEIIIAKAGKPVAKLVPIDKPEKRRLGLLADQLTVSDDFDARFLTIFWIWLRTDRYRDPFDRLLIAQAMSLPTRLLTADAQLTRCSELVTLV